MNKEIERKYEVKYLPSDIEIERVEKSIYLSWWKYAHKIKKNRSESISKL